MTDKKGITVYLDEKDIIKFRIISAKERKSMSKLLAEMVLEKIKEDENNEKT